MGDAATKPAGEPPEDAPPLPDLSLYSSPQLAMHLLAELEIRHQNDAFVLLIHRDVDGDRAAYYERYVGDEYRIEGLVGAAYRHVRRQNDRAPGRWRGDRNKQGFYEAGPVPGSADE